MKRLTFLFLMVALAVQTQAGIPDPKGAWEFNGPDTNNATIGAPLGLVGSVQEIAGIKAGDGAIQIGEGSYYICTHGIAPNGGGTKVNEWTLLIDFSYPPSSRSDPPNGYNDLFQTNPTNVDDSDWTINSSGGIGIGAVGYSSAHGFSTVGDTWYRLVVVVDNGVRHDVYVDGVEIFKGNQQGVDGRFSLAATLLLFCAGNNQDRDDAPINVSTVAIWDTPLSASDILTLGRAGDKFFIQKRASNPTPADGSNDVLITTDLAWTPGEYAATHNVYFGLSREDVDAAAPAALIAEGLDLDITSLDVGRLDFGQTYYWRVDEVNAAPDNTVFKGQVWSFTAEPYAYPITNLTVKASGQMSGSPAIATIDRSGLNALDQHSREMEEMWISDGMPAWIQYTFDKEYKLDELWVWNANSKLELSMGFGARDVTIEYSADGETWTPLENVPEFTRGTSTETYTANTKIDFAGVTAKHVRLTINATYGLPTATSLSEVRFYHVPVQAFGPQPADGATGVSVETDLDWRPGREATSHVVYIATDSNAVADGVVAAETRTDHSYTPSSLSFATEYFWRVDEVGDTGVYAGDVWSFTTEEYAVVDDFESYTDDMEAEETIWHAWIDGLTDNKSGSVVGWDNAPFAERTIVHGGAQSMPLRYNNTDFTFSEATRTFDSARDWTMRGIKTLSLYFAGTAGNGGQLYVKINNTKVAYDGEAADLARVLWQAWNIDLSTVGDVSSVRSLTIGVEGAGAAGTLYIDDIRLYPKAPEFSTPAEPDSAGLVAYYSFDNHADDGSGNGNHGTLEGSTQWTQGMLNGALQFNGADTRVVAPHIPLNSRSFTIAMWVNPMLYTAEQVVFSQTQTSGTDTDLHFRLGGPGVAAGNVPVGGVRMAFYANDLDTAGGLIQDNNWYHITFWYDFENQDRRIYIDGVQAAQASSTPYLGTSGNTIIGAWGTGQRFMGIIDDVQVYHRALSAEEVAWLAGRRVPIHKPL